MGHNPSNVWRSILRAWFIVRGGACWFVGTGESIPILNEPWLQGGKGIDGNFPENYFLHNYIVRSLMDTGNKQWNTYLILRIFNVDQAKDILQTPLVPQVPEDRLIWKGERNGLYLVNSAYRLCMEELIVSGLLGWYLETKGSPKNSEFYMVHLSWLSTNKSSITK